MDKLRFAPCLPADRKGFTVYYRYRETVDGRVQPDGPIPLVDDRRKHSVEVVIHYARG